MNKERLLNIFLDLVKIYSPSKNEINVMKYIIERLDQASVSPIQRGAVSPVQRGALAPMKASTH